MILVRIFIAIFLCRCLISCNGKNSQVKINYFEDGKVKSIKTYKNGILDGQSQWFFQNGNIEQIVHFENGHASGAAYYFYSNGKLKNFTNWREDTVITGRFAEFYNNDSNRVKSEIIFTRDGEVSLRKDFDTAGNLTNEIQYKTN